MSAELLNNLKKRMEGALAAFHHELKGLRTGRASTNFVEGVLVEAYGDRIPLQQVSTVTAPDARTLLVQVWDKSMVKPVEKALVAAELGLNPMADGQLIRLVMPPLSEERRKELVKIAHKYAEQSKVSIRNLRRDGLDQVKKMEKDNLLNQDGSRQLSDEVQKIVDDYIKQVDQILTAKEKDILQM